MLVMVEAGVQRQESQLESQQESQWEERQAMRTRKCQCDGSQNEEVKNLSAWEQRWEVPDPDEYDSETARRYEGARHAHHQTTTE